MSLPDLVQTHLNDESVAARVSLGGEDELFVTPTRTLIYRAEGLLSDEAVEEYSHGAERIVVSEGRRKAKISLDYGLDGEQSFAVPSKRLDSALHPVIAGVLNAAGITGPGETVKQTFQFSELTLVITSARVVKHIGSAVWDGDYEEFHYDDVTDLTFEDGSVATSVVLTTGGRQERFKAPNEDARAVRESLTNAMLAHHNVQSLEEFRVTVRPDEGDEQETRENMDFGDGPDPLSANPGELSGTPANATRTEEPPTDTALESTGGVDSPAAVTESLDRQSTTSKQSTTESTASDVPNGGDVLAESTGFEGSGFEAAVDDDGQVAEELAALTEAVERQNDELQKQRQTMETLIDELRQGR